jgi:hypothetical protein
MSELNPFDGLDTIAKAATSGKEGKTVKKTAKQTKQEVEAFTEVVKKESDSGVPDSQQKAKLIYSIQQYGKNKRLGTYLRQECGHRYDDAYLSKLTIANLQLELEKQEVALGSRSNGSMIDVVLKNGLTLAENAISSKTKFNITGTTHQLYEDDHYLDLLERVKMKYTMPFVRLDPVMELAMSIAQTAMVVHAQNKMKENLIVDSTILDKEVSGDDLENLIIT